MPFLTYFDPASTDPSDHVDREADVAWLCQSLMSHLKSPDKSRGRAVAILGERGTGKSTLTRKAIDQLREHHRATTLFLTIDCRRIRTQRRIYEAIAAQAVNELGFRADVPGPLKATARLLEAIASMDTVKQTTLYERMAAFRLAVKLSGNRNLLRLLALTYDINLERSGTHVESLEGSIHFDGHRLRDAVVAFFQDLRNHDLDTIVVLDNLDELDHEAVANDAQRQSLLEEIDALLGLTLAPIGLVLTVRSYFASSLTRAIDGNRVLHRLSNTDQVELLRKRLAREPKDIRAQFEAPACDACIERLARRAPTPLALLKWFNYLAQNELQAEANIEHNLRGLARDQFATVRLPVLEAVVASFDDPNDPIPEADLLAACGNNRSVLAQLMRYQIVLPVDFWHPTEFTLSPDLHFMWTSKAT
ncbi:MAG: AAA family ATPase [Enhygromyxa sp.]